MWIVRMVVMRRVEGFGEREGEGRGRRVYERDHPEYLGRMSTR